MLRSGILNPGINSLLSRVRHTNTLVIADRGFPSWPNVETVDISLVDGIPSVLQVLNALLPNFSAGRCWMAQNFLEENDLHIVGKFQTLLPTITWETHEDLKLRVPKAVGIIRTADTTQYANVILESA